MDERDTKREGNLLDAEGRRCLSLRTMLLQLLKDRRPQAAESRSSYLTVLTTQEEFVVTAKGLPWYPRLYDK